MSTNFETITQAISQTYGPKSYQNWGSKIRDNILSAYNKADYQYDVSSFNPADDSEPNNILKGSLRTYLRMLEAIGYATAGIVDQKTGTIDFKLLARLIIRFRRKNKLTDQDKALIDHPLIELLTQKYSVASAASQNQKTIELVGTQAVALAYQPFPVAYKTWGDKVSKNLLTVYGQEDYHYDVSAFSPDDKSENNHILKGTLRAILHMLTKIAAARNLAGLSPADVIDQDGVIDFKKLAELIVKFRQVFGLANPGQALVDHAFLVKLFDGYAQILLAPLQGLETGKAKYLVSGKFRVKSPSPKPEYKEQMTGFIKMRVTENNKNAIAAAGLSDRVFQEGKESYIYLLASEEDPLFESLWQMMDKKLQLPGITLNPKQIITDFAKTNVKASLPEYQRRLEGYQRLAAAVGTKSNESLRKTHTKLQQEIYIAREKNSGSTATNAELMSGNAAADAFVAGARGFFGEELVQRGLTDYFLTPKFLEGKDKEVTGAQEEINKLKDEVEKDEDTLTANGLRLNEIEVELKDAATTPAKHHQLIKEKETLLKKNKELTDGVKGDKAKKSGKSLSEKKAELEEKRQAYYQLIAGKVAPAVLKRQILEVCMQLAHDYFVFSDWASELAEFWEGTKPAGAPGLNAENLNAVAALVRKMAEANHDKFEEVGRRQLIKAIKGQTANHLKEEEIEKAIAPIFKGELTYVTAGPSDPKLRGKEWSDVSLCVRAGKPVFNSQLSVLLKNIYVAAGIDLSVDSSFNVLRSAAAGNLALRTKTAVSDPETTTQEINNESFAALLLRSYGGKLSQENYREIIPDHFLLKSKERASLAAANFSLFAADLVKRKKALELLLQKYPQMGLTVEQAWSLLAPLVSGEQRLALLYNQNLDSEIKIKDVKFVLVTAKGLQPVDKDGPLIKLLQNIIKEYFPGHPRSLGLPTDNMDEPFVLQALLANLSQPGGSLGASGETARLEAITFSLLRDLLKSPQWQQKDMPEDKKGVLQKALEAARLIINHLVASGKFSDYIQALGQAKTEEAYQKAVKEFERQINEAVNATKGQVEAAFTRIQEGFGSQRQNLADEVGDYKKKLDNYKDQGYETSGEEAKLVEQKQQVQSQLDYAEEENKANVKTAAEKQKGKIAKETARKNKEKKENEKARDITAVLIKSFSREMGMQESSGTALANTTQYFAMIGNYLQAEYETIAYNAGNESDLANGLFYEKSDSLKIKPGISMVNRPFISALLDGLARRIGTAEGTALVAGGSDLGPLDKLEMAKPFSTFSLSKTTAQGSDSAYEVLTVAPLAVLRLFMWKRMNETNPVVNQQGKAVFDLSALRGKEVRSLINFLKEEVQLGNSYLADEKMSPDELLSCFEEVADLLDANPNFALDNTFIKNRLIFVEAGKDREALAKINRFLNFTYFLMDRLERLATQVEREQRKEAAESRAGKEYQASALTTFLGFFDSSFSIPAPTLPKNPENIDRNRIIALKSVLFPDAAAILAKFPDLNRIQIKSHDGKTLTYERSFFEGALAETVDAEWILRFIDKYGPLLKQPVVSTLTGAHAENGFPKDPEGLLREFADKMTPEDKFSLAPQMGESRKKSQVKQVIMVTIMRWQPKMGAFASGKLGSIGKEKAVLSEMVRGMVRGQGLNSPAYPYGMYLKAFLLRGGKIGYANGLSFADNQVNSDVIRLAGAQMRSYLNQLKNIDNPAKRKEQIDRFIIKLGNDGLNIKSLDDLEKWVTALEKAPDNVSFEFVYGNRPRGQEEIADALQIFERSFLPYFEYRGEGEEAPIIIENLLAETVAAAGATSRGVTWGGTAQPTTATYPTTVWPEKLKATPGRASQAEDYLLKGVEFKLLMHYMIQLPMQLGTVVQLGSCSGPYAFHDLKASAKTAANQRLSFLAFQLNFYALLKAGALDIENGNWASGIYQIAFAGFALKQLVFRLAGVYRLARHPGLLPQWLKETFGHNLVEWKKAFIETSVRMVGGDNPGQTKFIRRVLGEAMDAVPRAGNLVFEPLSEIARLVDWAREDLMDSTVDPKKANDPKYQFKMKTLEFWRTISKMEQNPTETFEIETPKGKCLVTGRDFIRLLKASTVGYRLEISLLTATDSIPLVVRDHQTKKWGVNPKSGTSLNFRAEHAKKKLLAKINGYNSDPQAAEVLNDYLGLARNEIQRFRLVDWAFGSPRKNRRINSADRRVMFAEDATPRGTLESAPRGNGGNGGRIILPSEASAPTPAPAERTPTPTPSKPTGPLIQVGQSAPAPLSPSELGDTEAVLAEFQSNATGQPEEAQRAAARTAAAKLFKKGDGITRMRPFWEAVDQAATRLTGNERGYLTDAFRNLAEGKSSELGAIVLHDSAQPVAPTPAEAEMRAAFRALGQEMGLSERTLAKLEKPGQMERVAVRIIRKLDPAIFSAWLSTDEGQKLLSDPEKGPKIIELLEQAQSRSPVKQATGGLLVGLVTLLGADVLAKVLGIEPGVENFVFVMTLAQTSNYLTLKMFEKGGLQKAYGELVKSAVLAKGTPFIGRFSLSAKYAGSFSLKLVKGLGLAIAAGHALDKGLETLGVGKNSLLRHPLANAAGSLVIAGATEATLEWLVARSAQQAARHLTLWTGASVATWGVGILVGGDLAFSFLNGSYANSVHERVIEKLKKDDMYEPGILGKSEKLVWGSLHNAAFRRWVKDDNQGYATKVLYEILADDRKDSALMREELEGMAAQAVLPILVDKGSKEAEKALEELFAPVKWETISGSELLEVRNSGIFSTSVYVASAPNPVNEEDVYKFVAKYMQKNKVGIKDQSLISAVLRQFSLKSAKQYLALVPKLEKVMMQSQIGYLRSLDPASYDDTTFINDKHSNEDIRTMFTEKGEMKKGQAKELLAWALRSGAYSQMMKGINSGTKELLTQGKPEAVMQVKLQIARLRKDYIAARNSGDQGRTSVIQALLKEMGDNLIWSADQKMVSSLINLVGEFDKVTASDMNQTQKALLLYGLAARIDRMIDLA
jgi:hypothetical protein